MVTTNKFHSNIANLFCSGKDFTLTAEQYEEKIGRELPKEASYLKHRSTLAKIAKEHGYSIEVSQKPIIQRTVTFTKDKN